MSSISATINGSARLLDSGSDEETFYRSTLLENNTFDPEPGADFLRRESIAPTAGAAEGDGGRECFVAGEEVRVLVVSIQDVRIADWKGNVRDWVLEGNGRVPRLNGA